MTDDPAAVGAEGRRRSEGTVLLAVGGLVVGLLLGVLVVVVSGGGGDDRLDALPTVPTVDLGPVPSAAAADRLVTALRRSRTATFSLVEDHRRIAPNGAEVVSTRTTRVQRPPDSLVRTDRTIDLVLAGRRTACAASPEAGGGMRCRSEPSAPVDVDAAVREEASLLTGPSPLYTVAQDAAGCYRLVLRVERLAPPYGRRASLCFDPATGSVATSEVVKAGADGTEVIDRTWTSEVRGSVADADLVLPAGVEAVVP